MNKFLYNKKLFFTLFCCGSLSLQSSNNHNDYFYHFRNPLFECWFSSSTDDAPQQTQGLLTTVSVGYGAQENYPTQAQEMDRTAYPQYIKKLEQTIVTIDQTTVSTPGLFFYGQETLQHNKKRIDYNQAGLDACQQAQQQKFLKIDKNVQLHTITTRYQKQVMQNKRECCYTSLCCFCCLPCVAHGAANNAQQDVKKLVVDLKKLHR